ncbi:hypothetical protein PTKIN_Ptkin18bG0109300 [Pterospermum kingtungense]
MEMRGDRHVVDGWDVISVDPCTLGHGCLIASSTEGSVISLYLLSHFDERTNKYNESLILDYQLLRNNQLSGRLPNEIERPSGLQTLDLSGVLARRTYLDLFLSSLRISLYYREQLSLHFPHLNKSAQMFQTIKCHEWRNPKGTNLCEMRAYSFSWNYSDVHEESSSLKQWSFLYIGDPTALDMWGQGFNHLGLLPEDSWSEMKGLGQVVHLKIMP